MINFSCQPGLRLDIHRYAVARARLSNKVGALVSQFAHHQEHLKIPLVCDQRGAQSRRCGRYLRRAGAKDPLEVIDNIKGVKAKLLEQVYPAVVSSFSLTNKPCYPYAFQVSRLCMLATEHIPWLAQGDVWSLRRPALWLPSAWRLWASRGGGYYTLCQRPAEEQRLSQDPVWKFDAGWEPLIVGIKHSQPRDG